ncbi:glycoside hydrolase family 88/105 protein [Paenibacillus sp. UNC451MF]|uniref:glycoside hydrolase family 88/105 protein n=1 Tax=Paenibacillus sp. UNC451MF TaxID=1449063 RepID=UPI00048F80D9|nr:glycoside hydrolase family 88 protein [Paenibacillus sp. UNC451MF]
MTYFHERESIMQGNNAPIEEVLATVTNRFIGSHPKKAPVFRTFNRSGFLRKSDYRYEMNLHEVFPNMQEGSYVYVWGKLWMEQENDLPFRVSCYGPVRVYINGERKFQSNINHEVFPELKTDFRARLSQGWNHFVLEFVKTGTGCGGRFGTGSAKGFPLHFLAPSVEREGQEGWIYSEPQSERWSVANLPENGYTEADTGFKWLPHAEWSEKASSQGCFSRLFGNVPGQQAFAWSKLNNSAYKPQHVTLRGLHQGSLELYLNGQLFHQASEDRGSFSVPLSLSPGNHDLVVKSTCTSADWGLQWESLSEGAIQWTSPHPVEGLRDTWLYLGPFSTSSAPAAGDTTRLDKVFGPEGDETFWRADQPDTWVRPYLENTMFGKWNYPLGVTLYGILQTGKELARKSYIDYVADHIEQCTSYNEYAHWDSRQYGAPGLNSQLTLIDSLDDCGSFGATMLQTNKERELKGARGVADNIAHYITSVQDRLADDCLYRVRGTVDFMKDTIWCDDLYMSTPFLSRYYELTQDISYLNDAAKQFLLYKSKLFMSDKQIMHHVYDMKFDKPNGVPWGRGNGWVLFSLTELLSVMPEDHDLRGELISFLQELCEGYLRLQGVRGMWHQVLTDPKSYEEASCTSMFMYAFARAVRFGWIVNTEPYIQAVFKGWDGLAATCIDKSGNIYGVCRGSGYSFSSLYYKDQLSWLLNDTHGIGIVLLAGIETIRLRKFLTHS